MIPRKQRTAICCATWFLTHEIRGQKQSVKSLRRAGFEPATIPELKIELQRDAINQLDHLRGSSSK